MWKTATSGKLTNDATLTNIYEKYVCKEYYFGTSILGDPGAVSWVRKNGVESFQEWARVPLGCYSWRTSFTTYSNNCLWFGTKNNLVPNEKPISIPLLSRFSYTRKVNRKLDCSPYMFDSCRRAFFSENKSQPTKPNKFYNTPIPEKKNKTEVAWKWGLMALAANLKQLTGPYRLKIYLGFGDQILSCSVNRSYTKRTNVQLVENSSGAVWTKHKFASRPRPQKFSLSIKIFYYNSLKFSTKCFENPPLYRALYSFRVRWRKNLALLPEEITPEKISQISLTKRSLICCNTKPNYHV